MKKYTFQIILISLIFLYENTSPYWVQKCGEWSFWITLIYWAIFIFAIGFTIYNISKCIEAKLKNTKRNIITLLLIVVQAMPFLIPGGILPKSILYKGDLLVAYMNGTAGNDGWLTLYGNNIYEYEYGFSKYIKGKYLIKNDTIYFDGPRNEATYNFDYGTIKNTTIFFAKDSVSHFYMDILKNELTK